MSDPNAVTCGLCGQQLGNPNMELERHILEHRVPKGADRSPMLAWAIGTYREAPDEENLAILVKAAQAEERLRFQNFVEAAEEVAAAAGRVQRLSRNTGPTFWYDV